MEFGIDECAIVNIQRGKVTKTEGIKEYSCQMEIVSRT